MFDVFCLGLALTVGQGDPAVSKPVPLSGVDQKLVADDLPRRIPAALPTVTVPPAPQTPGYSNPRLPPKDKKSRMFLASTRARTVGG